MFNDNCRFSSIKHSYYNSYQIYEYDFISQNLLKYNYNGIIITNNYLCTINNIIYNKSVLYDINLYNSIIDKHIGKCYSLDNDMNEAMNEEMGIYQYCLMF